MSITEYLDHPSIDAFINALIVFGISIVTELLAIHSLPDIYALYHATLVALLSFLVFYAKSRGVNHVKTKSEPVTPEPSKD